MIILEDKKLIETNFTNEQEIEDLTIAISEHFFGPSSVFIPKAKIKTKDGAGTIPDGFAVDLASRTWFVVEAELGHHSVWTHIAPQVTKQLLAAGRPETRQLLTEILVASRRPPITAMRVQHEWPRVPPIATPIGSCTDISKGRTKCGMRKRACRGAQGRRGAGAANQRAAGSRR